MKKAISVGTSALVAAILTLTITVGAILYAMFSTSGDNERTTALFGGVVFETEPTDTGGTMATFGVENPVVIGVLFLILFAFCLLVAFFISLLAAHRRTLIRQRAAQDATGQGAGGQGAGSHGAAAQDAVAHPVSGMREHAGQRL